MSNKNEPRTLGRMSSSVERVFRYTQEGLYREVWLHWIHFLDEEGQLKSTKLDKTIQGKLWKIAKPNERSVFGECMHKFPEIKEPVRLVCISQS